MTRNYNEPTFFPFRRVSCLAAGKARKQNGGENVFVSGRGGMSSNFTVLRLQQLDSGRSGLGSSRGRGTVLCFLDKTLYSHSASLRPGV